jgi:hypothetical protein
VLKDHPDQGASSARAVTPRWVVAGAVIILVVVAATVTVLLLDRDREGERRSASDAVASGTLVTSPYDLIELPANAKLDRVDKAVLVSVFVPNESGALTSYGMRADLPDAQALMNAVKDADEVDPDVAAAELGSKAAESRLTFVFPSRETLTFALYLDQGLIARDTTVWRPDGDLRALIQAATTGPE